MQRIYLTENDTWPLTGTINNSNGAMNITGWSVSLEIGYETPVKLAGTITNAETGAFEVPFETGDLIAGEWDATIEITNASGQIITTNRCRLIISAEVAP